MSTTVVRCNDRFVTASIALGDLFYVRPYSSWHSQGELVELRFKHGSIEIDSAALADLIRQSQEALASARTAEPNCSGALANIDGNERP